MGGVFKSVPVQVALGILLAGAAASVIYGVIGRA